MNAALVRFKEWFAQLAPRERWMVSLGAAAVALTLLYVAVWEPLVKTQQRRAEALSGARGLASRIEELAALAQNARGGNAANLGASILSAVDQSARTALEKQPSRIQPEGDKEVKVWLEDVPFDSLMRWQHELESRYGIRAQTAEIEKQATSGMVSARLSLVR